MYTSLFSLRSVERDLVLGGAIGQGMVSGVNESVTITTTVLPL